MIAGNRPARCRSDTENPGGIHVKNVKRQGPKNLKVTIDVDADAVIVGNGPLESELRERVFALDMTERFTFLPPQPDEELAADNGMDVFRIFDAMNDLRNFETAVKATLKVGKHAQGTMSYTVSPVHGIPQFVAMAKQLESMGCDSVAIKDMAGLLTPMVTAELVAELVKAVSVPIHLHSHATSGTAEMCHLKAIENGCCHIDTAISSFAGGASHPPTESTGAALRKTADQNGLDRTA